MQNLTTRNNVHISTNDEPKEAEKSHDDNKRFMHFDSHLNYKRESLLRILYSSLELCRVNVDKSSIDSETNTDLETKRTLVNLSKDCEIIVDLWEKHGNDCPDNSKDFCRLGSLTFPVCHINEHDQKSIMEDYEPGTIIKRSLKGMALNNPDLFGLTPTENHKTVSYVPIIGCRCNTCHLTKFSLVESTQACKCKNDLTTNEEMPEVAITGSILGGHEDAPPNDMNIKKKTKKFNWFKGIGAKRKSK